MLVFGLFLATPSQPPPQRGGGVKRVSFKENI